jgi:hypothetical protein
MAFSGKVQRCFLSGVKPQHSSNLDVARTSIAELATLDPWIAALGYGGAPTASDVAASFAALAERVARELRESCERDAKGA